MENQKLSTQNQLLNTQLKSFRDSEEAQKKERLINEHLVDEENLRQKFLTEHLKDENTQLKNQLTAYENKWENLCNKTIDTFSKQLKDSEEAHRKELYDLQQKVEELKSGKAEKLEEHKKEVIKTFKDTIEIHKIEMLEKLHLKDEEHSKHNALTEELQEEIAQLKNQLTLAHVKQTTEWEVLQDSVINQHHKELNAREEIYEKRINKVISTFNKQLKDSEEAQRKELYDMQLKVEELKKEEAMKLEDTKEAHKKEIYNLQVKVEEHKREVAKTLQDIAEALRKEMVENIHLRDEEHIKYNALTKKLQEEITQLKNQLTLAHEKQATETEALQDSVKNLYHKELNAREEIYEKRINKVIDTFNKKLKDSEEMHRKEHHDMQLKVEELEDTIVAHKKEIYNLQVKVEEHKKEVDKALKNSEEVHRREITENTHLRDEENSTKHNTLAKKLQEEIALLKNQVSLLYEKQATERVDLQFTKDSVKNLNEVTNTLHKQLKDNEEIQRKEVNNLHYIVQELEEALRNELYDLRRT